MVTIEEIFVGGGYGDGGYGDGDDGDGGGGYQKSETRQMNEGLKILTYPSGGYYPYVFVGWLRRVGGDDYELVGARIIRRFGRDGALVNLAEKGPQSDTQLLDAAKHPEPVHRLLMGRVIQANAGAWKKECPKPKDWKGQED